MPVLPSYREAGGLEIASVGAGWGGPSPFVSLRTPPKGRRAKPLQPANSQTPTINNRIVLRRLLLGVLGFMLWSIRHFWSIGHIPKNAPRCQSTLVIG